MEKNEILQRDYDVMYKLQQAGEKEIEQYKQLIDAATEVFEWNGTTVINNAKRNHNFKCDFNALGRALVSLNECFK